MYSTPQKKTQDETPGTGQAARSFPPSKRSRKWHLQRSNQSRWSRGEEEGALKQTTCRLLAVCLARKSTHLFGIFWGCDDGVSKTNQPFEAPRKKCHERREGLVVSRFRIRLGTWKKTKMTGWEISSHFSIGNTSCIHGGFFDFCHVCFRRGYMVCELPPRQRLHDFVMNLPASSRIHVRDFFQHGIAIQMQFPDTQRMVYLPTCS